MARKMSLTDLKELGRDILIIGLELHNHLIACIGLIGYSRPHPRVITNYSQTQK